MTEGRISEARIFARHARVRGAVLIIGVGVVGGFLAEELASLGVNSLCLVDFDTLEVENLVRHPLHWQYLGQPKASSLAEQIRHKFPWCTDVVGVDTDFLELPPDIQRALVGRADIVVAAAEPEPLRQRINELSLQAEIPAVYPAVWVRDDLQDAEVGEIYWTLPFGATPCYMCWLRSRRRGAAGTGRTGHGTRADIKFFVLGAAATVRILLNPRRDRMRPLDRERNLILIHGFMPTSEAARLAFGLPGLRSQNVRVPFPSTPCPACNASEAPEQPRTPTTTPRTSASAGRNLTASTATSWQSPQRSSVPGGRIAGWALAIVVVIGLIFGGVNVIQSNRDAKAQRQREAEAAEQAAWRAPAPVQANNLADTGSREDVAASVAGGHLYYMLKMGSSAGTLVVSINAATGQQEWSYQAASQPLPEDLTAPVLVGDVIIAHTDVSLFALDVKNGQLRWEHKKPEGGTYAPIVAGGLLVVWNRPPDSISVLRTDTGAQLWTRDDIDKAMDPIKQVSATDNQILILHESTLESLDVRTGRSQWHVALKPRDPNDSNTAVSIDGLAAGLVHIVRMSSIEARKPTNGAVVWQADLPGIPDKLTASEQAVIVSTCVDALCNRPAGPMRTAYDPKSGQQLWQQPWRGPVGGLPTLPSHIGFSWLDTGTLLLWGDAPTVEMINASTGTSVWNRSFVTLRPAAVTGDDHLVYVVGSNGAAVATPR